MNRPIHGGNLVWASALAGCPPSSILDFSASINPWGPPESAIAAIERELKALRAYPDPHYTHLRSTLAEIHQLGPEWVLPGNGSAELLTWACRDLSQQEATYLITPAFSDYWRAFKTFGVKGVCCLLSLTEIDTPQLPLKRGRAQEKRGLLLNNPHNPTGKLWVKEALEPYLGEFDLVVVDEAFMDFLDPDRQESLIERVGQYPNLIVLRSLTKFYSLPGLRLGYAIAHPDRLALWQQWRDPWPVNVLAAAAGEAAVRDTAFQRQSWDRLRVAKAELYNALTSLEGLQPLEGAANFLLVRSKIPSSQLQEQLLKQHRILIRDCLSFPELGDRYFRVAVRTPAENLRLVEGLRSVLGDGKG